MRLEAYIRKLARSQYWQEIYNGSKTCSGIHLFKNTSNFSGIQNLFLYWLRVYDMLYNEMYKLEWLNLDEEVIKDNDRCDAFLYWRRKEIEKEIRKAKREQRKNSGKNKTNMMPIFSGKKQDKGGKQE